MADYHPLIARAVEGLKTTPAKLGGRSMSGRARPRRELREVEPAVSEAEITRERLALEEAIRKVEGENVRKTLSERVAAAFSPVPTTSAGTAEPSRRDGARRRRIANAGATAPRHYARVRPNRVRHHTPNRRRANAKRSTDALRAHSGSARAHY